MQAAVEVLLEEVFSAWFVQRGYKEKNWKKNRSVRRELPFREDWSHEAEEQPFYKPLPGNYWWRHCGLEKT
jgi:hypothetical protein